MSDNIYGDLPIINVCLAPALILSNHETYPAFPDSLAALLDRISAQLFHRPECEM